MNYDECAPFPVKKYREFQRIIPGIDGLYEALLAIFHYELGQNASILIIGAGGGREIELLSRSEQKFELLGVDPSADMLEVARSYIPADAASRVKLHQGYVADIDPKLQFSAATSVLVMHFLPDDGEKAQYLKDIRSKLKVGAPYIHVDVSIESDKEAENCGDVIARHGERIGAPAEVRNDPGKMAQEKRLAENSYVVTPARNRALLEEAGFEIVSPFFRSLWFTGWWARAV